jgi:hypothetical protein
MTDLGRSLQFQLHLLGWKAFQDLCATILREVLGQTFQTFAPGNDGGRDGAFRGNWVRKGHEAFEGAFVVQCKHTTAHDSPLTASILDDDIKKAAHLASKGLADTYLVLTNHSVTGARDAEVVQALKNVGVRHAACLGAEWISKTILESQRLRMLVPRVYGLGDLSQILDERAYAQAQQLFHAASDELARFVPTAAYREAAEALVAHGFVCLLGEPGSGKSTIAAALALHAADTWGTRSVRVAHPLEFKSHWNPQDPNQLFWVDDALGPLQYQRDFAQLWNYLFPELTAAIRGGTKVIWTSRDYIFQRALPDLKTAAFPLLKTSRVIINAGELSTDEKQEMLYNHLKMGDQLKEFRSEAKPHLYALSESKHMLPEIVRRLALRRFTAGLAPTRSQLLDFVERPAAYLAEVIDGLTQDERAALAVLFSRGGVRKVDENFTADELLLVEALGASAPGVHQAFRALNGTFLSLGRSEDGATWAFRHPTMRDATAELLIRDPALVRRYVQVTPIQQVMREVTCGDVGLQNVRVVLGPDLYEVIAERVKAALNSSGPFARSEASGLRDEALSFLSYRCSGEFLKLFRKAVPDLLAQLQFWSYLDAVSEVRVVVALHENGLLTEDERKAYVDRAAELGVETPDAGFLAIEGVRSMFTPQEMTSTMERVRKDLVGDVDAVIQNFRDNWNDAYDPDGHFAPLKEAFAEFAEWFRQNGDQQSAEALASGLQEIDDVVNSLQEDYKPPPTKTSRTVAPTPGGTSSPGGRGRFDDIDE